MEKERVVVGMSGGVDSSVSAYLLKEQGYEVIGLFMRNWEEEDENGICTSQEDYEDAKKVCNSLDIPYYTVNFSKQYKDKVFSHFLEEYRRGRTPNPDVLCNKEIKFGPFLDYASQLGAKYIATGHYCGTRTEGGLVYLTKAKDNQKDQTYFLNQLNQNQISRVLFPLSHMVKSEVREIAEKLNLSTATKKDSTGICFIGERNFRDFLESYFPIVKGDIVDISGKKVGEHQGLMYYTKGQRRGLGLGGTKENQDRWFVVDKDLVHNKLIVSHGDESVLLSNYVELENINWITKQPEGLKNGCNLSCKFRYRQEDQDVFVKEVNGKIVVYSKENQRAVTEGQYAVFYLNNDCLGGGVINKAFLK